MAGETENKQTVLDTAQSVYDPAEEIMGELDNLSAEAKAERAKKLSERAKKDEENARFRNKYGSGLRFGSPGQSGLIGMGSALGRGSSSQEGKSVGAPETEKAYGGEGATKFAQKVAQTKPLTLSEQALNLVDKLGETKKPSDVEKQINSLMEWVNSADEKDIDPDSAVADFMKWVKGFGYRKAVPELQGYVDYFNKVNELRTALRNEVLSGYMDSNGNFTAEGISRITDEAKSTTQKSNVQNDRLKALQAQGPTQQALPEFPKEDAKILAKVISGGIAQIMKGISLSMAPSDRSAAVGAIMADPGIQIMSGVAPMLAADIAGYEERKQAIEDKNILLLEQYNGRIDAAMAAFDRESNAAEREYVQMVNNGIYKKMDRLYKVFDYEKALILEEGKIRASMYDEINKAEYLNTREANQYYRTLMTLANEVRISASRASRAQRKNGLPDYSKFIVDNIAPMQLISANVSSVSNAVNEIAAWKEANGETMFAPQNQAARYLGTDVIPTNYIKNTGQLVAEGELTVDNQKNLDSIIIPYLASGRFMLKNTNPEALKRLAEAAIPNSAGEFAVKDPAFAQAFNDVMMPNIKEMNGERYWHTGYRAASVLAAEGIILARAGQAKTLATRMVKEKDNSKQTVDKAYRVIIKGE